MKYKYSFLLALCLTFFFGWAVSSQLQEKENQLQNLDFAVEPSKNAYLTGEAVNLTFRLKNEGHERVVLPNKLNTEDGHLSVYISEDGKNFKKYSNSAWGRVDAARGNIEIKPGESIETTADILWNDKPRVSHLNPDAAKSVTEGKILTDYVFPQAGTYFIKSIYSVYYFEGRLKLAKIESEPVRITIEKPAGDDLTVWNKIKNRTDIAQFIQQGEFSFSDFEEQEKLEQEFEQIYNQYPESIIARQIGQKLEKYKIAKEKGKAYLQKLREATRKKP